MMLITFGEKRVCPAALPFSSSTGDEAAQHEFGPSVDVVVQEFLGPSYSSSEQSDGSESELQEGTLTCASSQFNVSFQKGSVFRHFVVLKSSRIRA